MEKKLIKFLKCINCSNTILILKVKKSEKDDIIFGSLRCNRCKTTYEIKNGILITLLKKMSQINLSEMKSSDYYSNVENNEYNESEVNRIMYNYQFDYIEKFCKKDSLLDNGSGNGYFLEKHKENFDIVVGIDLSYSALLNSRKRKIKNLIQADSKNLPIQDNSFSNILTKGVIHHIQKVNDFLNEMSRIKKKDGRIIIQDKNHNNFLIPLIDKYILKLLMRKIGEASHVVKPMHHSKIIKYFKKKEMSKLSFCYHDIIAWASIIPLEKMRIKNKQIIQSIIFIDKILSKIPFLLHYFSWRYTLIII